MLTADIIDGFKKAGIQRSYKAGEPIFLVNEPPTGMYLILHGEARVVRRTPKGDIMDVAIISSGQTTGEMSLLLGQPHSATVIAKTDVEASLLTQHRLDDLRQEEPELSMRLFEILAYTLASYVVNVNRQLEEARKTIARLEERLREEQNMYSYF